MVSSIYRQIDSFLRLVCALSIFFTLSFSSTLTTKHFILISGKDEQYFQNRLQDIADEIEFVYETETKYFPKPTTHQIPIYLANTGLTHKDVGNIELPAYIAGYSALDEEGNPFFVINPYVTKEKLKLTLAHEFFHLVQYTYFDPRKMSQKWWLDNLWWLESTAVWAEYLVYPSLKSYIPYANYYASHHCEDIDTANMISEYSKVLIPLYINNPKIIAQSFASIEKYHTFIEFLDKRYRLDLLLFMVARKHFEGVDPFDDTSCPIIGLYGFDFSYDDLYQGISSIFDILPFDSKNMIISKVTSLDNPALYNQKETFTIQEGWNYLINLTEHPLHKKAYVYKNARLVQTDTIAPLQGYWYYAKKPTTLSWNRINTWKRLYNSFGSVYIKTKDIAKKYPNITLYSYQNGELKTLHIQKGVIEEDSMFYINPFFAYFIRSQ